MSKLGFPLFIILCIALMVVLQFGFIFLLVALMPSVMRYYTDSAPGKPAFKTILACNLAAALPMLAPMLQAGLRLKHFDNTDALSQPAAWLLIYGGAGMGWCLIYLCRTIARAGLVFSYDYNIEKLEEKQERLLEEWGQQIKHTHGV